MHGLCKCNVLEVSKGLLGQRQVALGIAGCRSQPAVMVILCMQKYSMVTCISLPAIVPPGNFQRVQQQDATRSVWAQVAVCCFEHTWCRSCRCWSSSARCTARRSFPLLACWLSTLRTCMSTDAIIPIQAGRLEQDMPHNLLVEHVRTCFAYLLLQGLYARLKSHVLLLHICRGCCVLSLCNLPICKTKYIARVTTTEDARRARVCNKWSTGKHAKDLHTSVAPARSSWNGAAARGIADLLMTSPSDLKISPCHTYTYHHLGAAQQWVASASYVVDMLMIAGKQCQLDVGANPNVSRPTAAVTRLKPPEAQRDTKLIAAAAAQHH